MQTEPSLILLDTHVWLWLASGVSKGISPSLRTLIDKLLSKQAVKISVISCWEIGNLATKNKIDFEEGVQKWIYRALALPGLGEEPIDAQIALDSTMLKDFHGDPADRIIVTTAKKIGATLITYDKEILSFAKKTASPLPIYEKILLRPF